MLVEFLVKSGSAKNKDSLASKVALQGLLIIFQ